MKTYPPQKKSEVEIPALSVIVPVYNAENFLSRCLDSLLMQGLAAYEIICVNDGSTDGTASILEKYRKENPDVVKVITQPNQGVSAARNTGILSAQGDIVVFCDADDYIATNGYAYVLENGWTDELDILKFDSITMDRYVLKTWKEPESMTSEIIYDGDGFGFFNRSLPVFPWVCFYRRSFLLSNELFFQNIVLGEDLLFNFSVFMCNPRTRHVNANIYRYTVSPTQTIKQRNPDKLRRMVDGYLLLFYVLVESASEYPEVSSRMAYYVETLMVSFISRVLSVGYDKEGWQHVDTELREMKILPLRLLNKVGRLINFAMSSYPVYACASFLYRKLFVPYVLPRLPRN